MNANINKRNPKYFCLQHVGDNFVQYCVDCKKNLCHFCTEEHLNHQRKNFNEDDDLILFENNKIKNKVEQVKEEKIKFFNILNHLQKELNKTINDFQQKEKNYDVIYRRNYETVKGANDIMNFNFKEFISLTINKYNGGSYDLSKLSNKAEEIKNNYVPNNNEKFSIFGYNNIIKKNFNYLRIVKNFDCNIFIERNNDNNNLNRYTFNDLSKEENNCFTIYNLTKNPSLSFKGEHNDNVEENKKISILNQNTNNSDNQNDYSNDNQNMSYNNQDEKELSEMVNEESNHKNNNNL